MVAVPTVDGGGSSIGRGGGSGQTGEVGQVGAALIGGDVTFV